MKLAARVGRIVPPHTQHYRNRKKSMAAQGIDVIDFASGEPDFDTPEPVKAAAEAAIRAGFTKVHAPHQALMNCAAPLPTSSRRNRDSSMKSPRSSCHGAKHSLYNVAEALLEAGDEIIIPVPFWVSTRIRRC